MRSNDKDKARPLRLELPDSALVQVYRRMTVTERLAAAFSATALVRARIEAHLRGTRPEWSEAEVQAEVARRWLHGRG